MGHDFRRRVRRHTNANEKAAPSEYFINSIDEELKEEKPKEVKLDSTFNLDQMNW